MGNSISRRGFLAASGAVAALAAGGADTKAAAKAMPMARYIIMPQYFNPLDAVEKGARKYFRAYR